MSFCFPVRGRRRARFFVPVLICLALGAGACSPTSLSAPRKGDESLSVAPESGVSRLVRGSETTILRKSASVSPGDKVEVEPGDVALIKAGAARTLELWGATVEIGSESSFRLLSGRVLVRTASPTEIDAGDLHASASKAVFRVDKLLATRVANYSGNSVTVASGPDSLKVPAYRQVVTVQGVLPKMVQPLRFSASDRWDRRLVAEAIDLDARVANFAQGLEAQLGPVAGIDFLSRVAAGEFNVDFLTGRLDSRRSDLLIGLMVSAEAKKLQGLPIDLRFDRIFRLWEQGASWGLLAQEFGVASDVLFARLTQAVGRAQIVVIGPGPGLLRPPPAPARAPSGLGQPASGPAAGQNRAVPRPAARPSNAPLLPAPLRTAVPPPVKTIVDDLYGVVDPVTGLPPVL